jgi:acid phosphatase (class A)
MKAKEQTVLRVILISGLLLSLLAGNATANPPDRPSPDISLSEKVGALPGYLASSDYPDSLRLLPPPPSPGSAAFELDEDVARRTFAVRGTARFDQALSDYTMTFPHAAGIFSCALNAPITEQDTPRLYKLLRRTLTDAGRAPQAAKEFYQRQRPFVLNKEPICAPETRERLESDGSYPSGHTTVGWAWALILAEASPDQADAVFIRARTFGESRNVCNHHWFSDVDWGRTMGAVIVARLHASREFRADIEAARKELAAVREKKLQTTRDCGKEAAALAIKAY